MPHRIIIVGGGISALLCAVKLVENSPTLKVTLINRARFGTADDDGYEPEQWNHTHVLSAKGLEMLYGWIPGSYEYLNDWNAPILAWGTPDVDISFPKGKLTKKHPLGVVTRSMTRNLLERIIRNHVIRVGIDTGQIEFVERVDVTGLLREGDSVVGVKVTPRSGAKIPNWFEGSSTEGWHASAHEVILAAGSGTRWYDWLREVNAEVPPALEVDARMSYMSADFEDVPLPVEDDQEAKMFATGDKFDRAMVIAKVEGHGIYRVTMFVYNLDELPSTETEFINLATTISPEGASYLARGRMISKVHKYQKCESRMHQVWLVKNWLKHLYLLGDSLAKFNPKFGQGITLSMLEIELLARELMYGSSHTYNKKVQKLLSFPWTMVSSADYEMKRSYGDTDVPPETAFSKLMGRYSGHLLSIAGRDENWPVARAFFQVSNFMSGPEAMLDPRVLYIAAREKLAPKEQYVQF